MSKKQKEPRIKRNRYNFKQVLLHWDDVIFRLCDEVTPHDVLEVVSKYVDMVIEDCNSANVNNVRFVQAKAAISVALNLIDPEAKN